MLLLLIFLYAAGLQNLYRQQSLSAESCCLVLNFYVGSFCICYEISFTSSAIYLQNSILTNEILMSLPVCTTCLGNSF